MLVDLPLDIQMAEIDYDDSKDFTLPINEVKPDISKIKIAMDKLVEAKAPLFIMGGGVVLSDGVDDCIALAEY